jgi:hypothetical protein
MSLLALMPTFRFTGSMRMKLRVMCLCTARSQVPSSRQTRNCGCTLSEGGKSFGSVPPLAAGFHHIEQAIDRAAQVHTCGAALQHRCLRATAAAMALSRMTFSRSDKLTPHDGFFDR